MAYIEERNRSKTSPLWRVIWREGKDRHSETFKVYEKAIEFKAHVDAYGQRCPPGWTLGYGWPGTFTPPLPAPVEGERSITTAAFVLASALDALKRPWGRGELIRKSRAATSREQPSVRRLGWKSPPKR